MSLSEMACNVLETPNGRQKTALSREFASQWFQQRNDLKATDICLLYTSDAADE